MSFMALWGGIFILYSSFINAYRSYTYVHEGEVKQQQKFLRISALIYVFFHLALVFVFGRWANDFVHNRPDMTLIAASLRNGRLMLPSAQKLFDGSSVLTIAANLLVLSFIIPKIFNASAPETAAPTVWDMVLSVRIAEMGSSISSFIFLRRLPVRFFLSMRVWI